MTNSKIILHTIKVVSIAMEITTSGTVHPKLLYNKNLAG
jgi:hypothetical protein